MITFLILLSTLVHAEVKTTEIVCPAEYTGGRSAYLFLMLPVDGLPTNFQKVSVYSSKVPFNFSNCPGNTTNFACHYGKNPSITLLALCKNCKDVKPGVGSCSN